MKCSICGKEIKGYGNNPYPVRIGEDDRCCDECNAKYVIPVRILQLRLKDLLDVEKIGRMPQDKLDMLVKIIG